MIPVFEQSVFKKVKCLVICWWQDRRIWEVREYFILQATQVLFRNLATWVSSWARNSGYGFMQKKNL